MNSIQTGSLLLLALSICACRSQPKTAADLHADSLAADERAKGFASLDPRQAPRVKRNVEQALASYSAGQLTTADDQFHAASVVVMGSNDPGQLNTAREMALESARAGHPEALEVAATALDKSLVSRGLPQKYGTQFVFDTRLAAFRMAPVEPNTSDLDRQAVGLPPLSELLKVEEFLNERGGVIPAPKLEAALYEMAQDREDAVD